jgi:hypothetical protein
LFAPFNNVGVFPLSEVLEASVTFSSLLHEVKMAAAKARIVKVLRIIVFIEFSFNNHLKVQR